MEFRIAVAQFSIRQLDPELNLKRAEIFVKKARKRNANVIVFPEDFITGPLRGNMRQYADSVGKYPKYFQRIAKKHKIDIVAGSIIENQNGKFYNTSYYIDRTGKIKGKYRKINLWHSERNYLTAGEKIKVFKRRGLN